MADTSVVSIQLYTLRSLGDMDRILDAARTAGYRHVEMVGSYLDDAAAVRGKLDTRGLKVSSSHVGLAALRERPQAVAAACRTLGFTQLFMPSVSADQRQMDASGWRALGRELGEMARRFGDQGIGLGYHNHNWELEPKDGAKTALELIFEEARDTPLTWQVDIAWLVRGHVDPKEWMKRYGNLVVSAHVKDIAREGQNLDEDGWADVGSGVLDWRDLWRACRDAGAKWMVVEHDKPADPASSARASYEYLARLDA